MSNGFDGAPSNMTLLFWSWKLKLMHPQAPENHVKEIPYMECAILLTNNVEQALPPSPSPSFILPSTKP